MVTAVDVELYDGGREERHEMVVRLLLPSLLLLLPSAAAAQPRDVEILGFSSDPSAPVENEPFDIRIDMLVNGCLPEITSVQLRGFTIALTGQAGPPVDGGCVGAIYESPLSLRMAGLPAGLYQVELELLTRREGNIADSGNWQLAIGIPAVPALSHAGFVALACFLAFSAFYRLAV